MPYFAAGVVCLAVWCALGCGRRVEGPRPAKWSTAYWFWRGSAVSKMEPAPPLEVLFVHAGTINYEPYLATKKPWTAHSWLAEEIPPARVYWLVFRNESKGVPDPDVAPQFASAVREVRQDCVRRGMQVAGIQLDIDAPTRSLGEYSALLREVRKELGPDVPISITALLDWFREGTKIEDVLDAVDEFVPQFYDVGERGYGHDAPIAARLDAAKWAARLNGYRKRFRIGISTFGRVYFVPKTPGRHVGLATSRDLVPLDLAMDPAFELKSSRTDANELLLHYGAVRPTRLGYQDFNVGDGIEFVIPTPESIGGAVEQAKRLGDYCAGVVFFRWPARYETLTVPPANVLAMAGGSQRSGDGGARLEVLDGECATVNCVDLFLLGVDPLLARPVRYQVDSSVEFEYFVPNEKIPARLSKPAQVELALPAYGGRGRMYLGRAVTIRKAEYRLREER